MRPVRQPTTEDEQGTPSPQPIESTPPGQTDVAKSTGKVVDNRPPPRLFPREMDRSCPHRCPVRDGPAGTLRAERPRGGPPISGTLILRLGRRSSSVRRSRHPATSTSARGALIDLEGHHRKSAQPLTNWHPRPTESVVLHACDSRDRTGVVFTKHARGPARLNQDANHSPGGSIL